MRELNIHNTWENTVTQLMYIVRRDHHLIQIIAPFDDKDTGKLL